jgi:excisionase family DNA binding protein
MEIAMVPVCGPTETDASISLSSEDQCVIREISRRLQQIPEESNANIQIRIAPEHQTEEIYSIPLSAFRLLAHILTQLARGGGVTLTSIDAELTTTEAAHVLKVSRPFLVRLLEKGEIPFHKTGTHRRIRYRDLMAYKQKNQEERLKALEELSELDQEYGLR